MTSDEGAALALKSLRSALSRSPSDLQLHQRTDGIQELRVVRGFRHATMVVRGPDEQRRIHCVNDADEAVRLLQGEPE